MYEAVPPQTPGSEKTEAAAKEGAARGRMTLKGEVDVDKKTEVEGKEGAAMGRMTLTGTVDVGDLI